MSGDERCVAVVDDRELETETLGVLEPQAVVHAPRHPRVLRQPMLPEVERSRRADAKGDRVHHPHTGATAAGARVLEEGDVRPGTARLVRVEEVVDRRIVLVDRLLDHPQTEHARVEVDVPRSVTGDARHVMNTVESHRQLPAALPAPCDRTRRGR